MEEKPKRKHLRLKEYDYNEAGYYFVTICTRNRKCILGYVQNTGSADGYLCENVGDAAPGVPLSEKTTTVELSPYGKITEKYLLRMEGYENNLRLHKYCIMPNHIHMLIEIDNSNDCGTPGAASPTRNHVSEGCGH